MITPGQVSDSLTVPSSTIRRWAKRFDKFLSQQQGKKRVYTLSDLDTLRQIRDLSAQGLTLDQIANALQVVEQPQPADTALISPEAVRAIEQINNQLMSLQQAYDKQQSEFDELRNQLKAFYDLPWYKRIGKKPNLESG